MKLFAEINNIDSVLSLLMMQNFDGIECGVSEKYAIGQFLHRGYSVPEVSRLTEMQPLEIALYYSGLVSPDDETMRIMLEQANQQDIFSKPLKYICGEPV